MRGFRENLVAVVETSKDFCLHACRTTFTEVQAKKFAQWGRLADTELRAPKPPIAALIKRI